MTRAKTQGGGGKVPRAATQGGGKPRRAQTGGLFNELEAAIDALDSDSSYPPKHAGARTEAARDAAKAETTRADAAKADAARDAAKAETTRADAAKADAAKPAPARRGPPNPPPGAKLPPGQRDARSQSLGPDPRLPPLDPDPRSQALGAPDAKLPPLGPPKSGLPSLTVPKGALPPPKRIAPGPTPASIAAESPQLKVPFPPRQTPPKPPPGGERAAAIRARETRAQSEVGIDEADAVEVSKPAHRVPFRAPPSTRPPANVAPVRPTPSPAPARPTPSPAPARPTPSPAPLGPRDSAPPGRGPPRPDSDDFSPIGSSIDIDLEDSVPAARAYAAYDSGPTRRPISEGARAISVGETPADDFVVEADDLPKIKPMAVAIFDDPPQIAAAKQALIVVGHKVVAAATGAAGIEQIKSLLRSGSADALLVGIPGGEALIETALALAPRRPVIIAATAGTAIEAVRRAASVGADLSIARPVTVENLAPVLLAATRLAAERHSATAARGSETMLRARLDAIVEPEPGALQPFELFQRVLELELKRSKRYGYPIAVALFAVDVGPEEPPPGVRGILRARAGNALIHSIRDIDLATEVDHERFLVLLPYTALAGAAEVARRIIHAVTSGNPIIAAGKTFPPKIVGAVAGGSPGQPVSFSRLMRDATQALEQARRDGAELAVPMVRGPGP